MKKIKPGQLYSYNGHIVRAKKRILGCHQCLYKDMMVCPNIVLKGSKRESSDCVINNIIFVKA